MNRRELANQFYNAYKNQQHTSLISNQELEIDVAEAYQIQRELNHLKVKHDKEEVIGYKISMTSEEMQRVVGKSNEPAYGTFTTNSLLKENIHLHPNAPLLLEPELVFILQEDLSAEADHKEIIQKSKIAAGLEVPSSRYPNWFPFNEEVKLVDIIADNAFAGYIHIGKPMEIPASIDWENIHARLFFNEQKLDEGTSKEVLGNPLNAVSWLNQKLHQQQQSLKRGMAISSGTFTDPVQLQKGIYQVEFDLLGQLSLTVG